MGTKSRLTKRKIHVDLPTELHQKLRIRAALDGLSIQALVAQLVSDAVGDLKIPLPVKKRGQAS